MKASLSPPIKVSLWSHLTAGAGEPGHQVLEYHKNISSSPVTFYPALYGLILASDGLDMLNIDLGSWRTGKLLRGDRPPVATCESLWFFTENWRSVHTLELAMDKHVSQLSQVAITLPGIAREIERLEENLRLYPPSLMSKFTWIPVRWRKGVWKSVFNLLLLRSKVLSPRPWNVSSWTRLILLLDKSKISSDVSWENWNLSRVWSLFWDNDRYCNLEHPFNRFCGNLEYWSVSTYYCSVNKREEFKEEKSSLDVSENIVVPPFVWIIITCTYVSSSFSDKSM